MRIVDRKELWPKLESLGVSEVKRRLAAGELEVHEEEEVQEWVNRKSSISIARDAKIAKYAALVAAVAAVTTAIVNLWRVFCK